MAAPKPETTSLGAAAEAKRLMRLARTGALATLDRASGAPLTTSVGCASDFDGAPLFLLSTLAQHTRNLASDPRASLLLASPAERGDPLNHPRISLGGPVSPHLAPDARKRYLQRNPKARLYAAFADFAMFRMRIDSVHYNGGFGRAAALTCDDILAPAGDSAALIEAESLLLDEVNRSKRDLTRGGAPAGRAWRAVGLDAEGLDLAAGARAARIDFRAPAFDPPSWRERLEEALA